MNEYPLFYVTNNYNEFTDPYMGYYSDCAPPPMDPSFGYPYYPIPYGYPYYNNANSLGYSLLVILLILLLIIGGYYFYSNYFAPK